MFAARGQNLWSGERMASRGRPFLFSRYLISVDGEKLDNTGQFEALTELQGKAAAHGPKAEQEKNFDTLIMQPRRIRVGSRDVFTWSVGQIVKQRLQAKYDRARDKLELQVVNDGSVRYSDFVAVPSLSVFAVDDRTGELHLGGKQAINRFRSVIRTMEGAELSAVFEASHDEVVKALREWSLSAFRFTIQPNNPRPVTRLAQALSDQMKKDGIGRVTGHARPAEATRMHMADDGFIGAAAGLVEAGYGQMSVSGVTAEGLEAEIKKPPFSPDVIRNEQYQEKPRELRIFVEDDGMTEEDVARTAATALIKFHTND